MTTRLYIGNLSLNTTTEGLKTLFGQHGSIARVKIVTDKNTGKPKGFGYVEMGTREAAQVAIAKLHGHALDGKIIKVRESQTQPGSKS
jgi:RNA recognition motif-containing protein